MENVKVAFHLRFTIVSPHFTLFWNYEPFPSHSQNSTNIDKRKILDSMLYISKNHIYYRIKTPPPIIETIKLLSGLWLVSKLGALSRENSKIE